MVDDGLHILHVTATLSKRGGGVADYIWQLARQGASGGVRSTVVGLWDEQAVGGTAGYADVGHYLGRVVGPRSVGYSPELRNWLDKQGGAFQVVHSHGLRMYPSYAARRMAVSRKLPLLISPHSMLDPWEMARHRLRKRVSHWLYEDANLAAAACLHATAAAEARHIRARLPDKPIAVVGLGMDVSQYLSEPDEQAVVARWPVLGGKKRLLFFSRISPKKGLVDLAGAWSQLAGRFPDWHLVIAGPDDEGHRAVVEAALRQGGVEGRALFTGPVYGGDKIALLASCHLMVLPSYNENFSLAVAESLASGVPVMTTRRTPWRELETQGCGWWTETGAKALEGAMREALSTETEGLRQMGLRGRGLIERRYSWPVVAGQMRQLYLWLVGCGPQPSFVFRADQPIRELS